MLELLDSCWHRCPRLQPAEGALAAGRGSWDFGSPSPALLLRCMAVPGAVIPAQPPSRALALTLCLLPGREESSNGWQRAEVIRLEQDVFTALAGRGKLYVYKTDGFWSQIKSAGWVLAGGGGAGGRQCPLHCSELGSVQAWSSRGVPVEAPEEQPRR